MRFGELTPGRALRAAGPLREALERGRVLRLRLLALWLGHRAERLPHGFVAFLHLDMVVGVAQVDGCPFVERLHPRDRCRGQRHLVAAALFGEFDPDRHRHGSMSSTAWATINSMLLLHNGREYTQV